MSETMPVTFMLKQTQIYFQDHAFSLQSINESVKASKIGFILGKVSVELMISLLSGFMLCAIFDATLYRAQLLPEIGFLGLFAHDQLVPTNLCIIAYTYVSYLYRCTIAKSQKYIVRESSSIQTGDEMYNILLSLPDVFTLGLTCLITTRQVYFAFHLLAFSVVLFSVIVACFDYWMYRMVGKGQQQQATEHNMVNNDRCSLSKGVQKLRKKATRTSIVRTENKTSANGSNSLCFSMV